MVLDRWHPVTHDMGLINASVETTVAEFLKWQSGIGTDFLRTDFTSGLERALEALPPLSSEKRRKLFIATENGWTAFFQSGIQGSDPFPVMSTLSKRLGVIAMRICSTHASAKWPGNVWEVYAPEHLGGKPPLGYLRSISAMNDGGKWSFNESGTPFPFEKTELYLLPRRSDRFNRSVFEEYLERFNLTPFSEGSYLVSSDQPAVILESCRRPALPVQEFTLEEVLAGAPWSRA